ncbi:MAG: FG-GAP repeat protein [Planctomycetes bacterium]|nr:FG-GAP repeat protein [Planctomycetota bacterium]
MKRVSGAVIALALGGVASSASAQVRVFHRISQFDGAFDGTLADYGHFGASVASLGDLDGDGVGDVAVGAPQDDARGVGSGEVWILFLRADGSVKADQRIAGGSGGFGGSLGVLDGFGRSLAALGDLDGDGVVDLAVGAPYDDDGDFNRGAVWILFLRPDGTVGSWQKISSIEGAFAGPIQDLGGFGTSMAALSDLDGDGVPDLAVGEPQNDSRLLGCGKIWILFLDRGGLVRSQNAINPRHTSQTPALECGEGVGTTLASPGDVNGDGVADLSFGAPWTSFNCGISDCFVGATWLYFMGRDGREVGGGRLFPEGGLSEGGRFGTAVGAVGDLDGNGVADVAAASYDRGFRILLLRSDAHVRRSPRVPGDVRFPGGDGADDFGASMAGIGDFDGDGFSDIAIGAPRTSDGGPERGAIWIFHHGSPCEVGSVNAAAGVRADVLHVNDAERRAVAAIGSPITIALDAPPNGPPAARYVLWLWNAPTRRPTLLRVRGMAIGCTVDPTPFDRAVSPSPIACLAAPGLPPVLCGGFSLLESPPTAPFALTRPHGFTRLGISFTLQGAIEDARASNPLGWSVTNAVTVETR